MPANKNAVSKEKWYLYRNPATGAEVKIVRPDHETRQTKTERKVKQDQLLNSGYKLMGTVEPGNIDDVKGGIPG